MKFIVDMPLSPEIAVWLRSLGHDAVHASDVALYRAPDSEILAYAQREARVVLTADLDFPRLLSQLNSSGPGLILLRGGNYSETESIECIRRALFAVPHDELPKSLVVVDRDRIRRRWLPI